MSFVHDDFLLTTQAARRLYHDYAEHEPIYDYHTHLPVDEIARDQRFESIAHIWLGGDHYKWRVMRANGVPESHVTGSGTGGRKNSSPGPRSGLPQTPRQSSHSTTGPRWS